MKNRKIIILGFACLLGCIMCSCTSNSQCSVQDMYMAFQSVPDSTRTKVWWFHGETETTHEGITADLEAFREAGVGGVIYYDQVHGDAKGAFPIFSPEWWDALKFSAAEAKRLGLTFEISLSNGFVAGGPWITKEMSMKRLCKSEVIVAGGTEYDEVLPMPSEDEFWDVKTLAFPVPDSVEWESKVLIEKQVKFHEPTLLTYDFGKPFTARSLTYIDVCPIKHPTRCMNWPGEPSDTFYGDGFVELPYIGQLEASDDGIHYKKVRDIPTLYSMHYRIKTIAFPAVTARYFRLNFHDWNHPDGLTKHDLVLRKAVLSAQAMTDEWEARAGVVSDYLQENPTPCYAPSEVIDTDRIIDLTDKMQADGRLTWIVPSDAKKWVVVRVAQESTKGHTKHGRPGQMGLECDKLSKEAAKIQWDHFAKVMIDTLAKYNLKPAGVVMDSHEMGSQNWTHGYEQEFKDLQEYDIMDYLPALLGYVMDSKEKTDEVLLDHRQTIAHLVNHRYFAVLDTLAMKEGVMLTAQAMGNAQTMVSDNIAAKGNVRRPQGEFWAKHLHSCYDIKEASSAAHVYGRPIASAEAFTDAKYSHTLSYLKTLADYAYAYQLNEFMVCASAYQPWLDKKPGNTANKREYCLNRNNTMWPLSRGFWDYQSRCAYMMRQGKPVVDICIYLGSEISTKLLAHRLPKIPEGYAWDVCTDDALLHMLYAEDGELKTKGGMEYQVLVIERLARLTSEAEAKIEKLKEQGVKVYDARIEGDYGLKSFLDKVGVVPDATFVSADRLEERLYLAHRSTDDAEIYFFVNHSKQAYMQEVTIRNSQGKVAEYWNPDNGKRYRLDASVWADGNLSIRLALAADEAGFVVLRNKESMDEASLHRTWGQEEQIVPIDGEWSVEFLLPQGSQKIVMPELVDWTMLEEEALKHHSGTAVYEKTVEQPQKSDSLKRIFVRIEGLEAVSRVWVNGREAGYVWCSPWEVDVTELLNDGENELRIEVANQLNNRMIGDWSLPEEKRSTYATTPIVKEGDKLLPAGITGNVSLVIR